MGLAGLLAACALCAASASTAQANDLLGGEPAAVAAVKATAPRSVAPAVNTVQRSVAGVRQTAERRVAAATPVARPVAQAPATVVRSVSPTVNRTVSKSPASHSSPKPAQQRKTGRKHRGGGAVAHTTATPAPSAERLNARRSTQPIVAKVAGAPAPQRSVSPRPTAPLSARGATVAPAEDPVPAPAAPSSAAAATAAGSAAGATAFLAFFTLIALAASRLGSLIRLPAGSAPMPPVLALPERPG